jgi:16S rRNA (cytosine967-C5)-methyltransferase
MAKSARPIALEALRRIDEGGYANLVVPALLTTTTLDERDRAFVTELAYGTTRMRRACDWLVDRFLFREVEPEVRNALRLGAYQLAFLQTPPHAAVSQTVGAVQGPARGLVNAVLRKVSDAGPTTDWPDEATRLSYPDWIVERLTKDLGRDDAIAALEQMNEAAAVTERPDGYVQDEASQWTADLVGTQPGDTVADVCAAPGGKATFMATHATLVVAGDVHRGRAGLVEDNVRRLGLEATVATYVADARRPPLRQGAFDRVLVDAPCSGLGVLRRRPDARWRIAEDDVADLTVLQRDLIDGAIPLVKEGGTLVYSVCTLTDAESTGIDDWIAEAHPELEAQPPPPEPWEPHGRGARLLPQAAGTDGMYVLRLRRHGR